MLLSVNKRYTILSQLKGFVLKERCIMEKEIIFTVDESAEGGFEARALGFSIFTQADTFDELKKMVQDAVLCHFDEKERPKVIRLHMVREELLAV